MNGRLVSHFEINKPCWYSAIRMRSFLLSGDNGDHIEKQPNKEVVSTRQQQDGSKLKLSKDYKFKDKEAYKDNLRAVWDTEKTSDLYAKKPTVSSNAKRSQDNVNVQNKRLKSQAGVFQNTTSQKPLETVLDALEHCRTLVEMQVRRAQEKNVLMNESVSGDAHVKNTIVTLLPDQFVRMLFIEVATNYNAVQRIKPLFGAPPYFFLRPEDGGLLRASGFASGRKNMAYEQVSVVPSYSQFGTGHFIDTFNREYKTVLRTELKISDQLPCTLDTFQPHKQILMNVKVPKRSKIDRFELFKNVETRPAVLFPRVGEVLEFKYSNALQKALGKTSELFELRVVVKSIVPRSDDACTASLVATKVSV